MMEIAKNWNEVFAMSRKGITGRVDIVYGVEFNLNGVVSHIVEANISENGEVDRIGERWDTATR